MVVNVAYTLSANFSRWVFPFLSVIPIRGKHAQQLQQHLIARRIVQFQGMSWFICLRRRPRL
jgi:hypothetical protein